MATLNSVDDLRVKSLQWKPGNPPHLLVPNRCFFPAVAAMLLPSTLFKTTTNSEEHLDCSRVSGILDALPPQDTYHLFYVVPLARLHEFEYEVVEAHGVSADSRLHHLRVSVLGMDELSEEEDKARKQALGGVVCF
jgi:hypothetical protein